jgi:hypothetical protein
MELNSSISSLSEDQLNSLFDNVSADKSTPKAEDLKIGKVSDSSIQNIDTDDLEDLLATDNDSSDNDSDDVDDKKKVDDTPSNTQDVDKEQTSTLLKNTAKFLIEKGEWKDVEGIEELEFTDELYADLSQKQAQEKVKEMFNEMLDSTGDYGKAILTHIKNGGNPDNIIDLFKEQKEVESLDITSELTQKEIIEKYYKEVVGWSKTKIDKYLNNLEAEEDGLEEESKEVKSKFGEIYKEKLKEIQKEQEENSKERERQEQEYINNLSKEIDSFEEFTDSDKKLVKSSLLKFNKKLEDGSRVSDFFIKFQQIQKDPKEYIRLVHFIMDRKGFEEKIRTKEETKAVSKSWNFIKGNNAINSKTSNDPDLDNKYSKISFKFKN